HAGDRGRAGGAGDAGRDRGLGGQGLTSLFFARNRGRPQGRPFSHQASKTIRTSPKGPKLATASSPGLAGMSGAQVPVFTVSPALRPMPFAFRALASQVRAFNGSPSALAPFPSAATWPFTRSTTGR